MSELTCSQPQQRNEARRLEGVIREKLLGLGYAE